MWGRRLWWCAGDSSAILRAGMMCSLLLMALSAATAPRGSGVKIDNRLQGRSRPA